MHRSIRLIARSVIVLVAAGSGLTAAAWWWLGQPLPLPASPYVFDAKSGASLRSVARELSAAGVLPRTRSSSPPTSMPGIDAAVSFGTLVVPITLASIRRHRSCEPLRRNML